MQSIGILDLSIPEFHELLEHHATLRHAEIVSIELYSEGAGTGTHSFLVLQLQRQGRKPVFLRLDRRLDRRIARFLLNSGAAAQPTVRTRY